MAVETVLAGFPLGGVIISGRSEKLVGTFCIYGGPIFVHYGELEGKQNPPPGRSQKGVCVVGHSVVSGAAGPLCRSIDVDGELDDNAARDTFPAPGQTPWRDHIKRDMDFVPGKRFTDMLYLDLSADDPA